LALLAGRFRLVPDEVTLEANPSPSERKFLAGWREAGVTRLSVGVQSFDDGDLTLLGRGYSAAEARDFCAAARDASYESLGLDLLVGVPRQSRAALERTAAAVRDLGPDHVSLYILENVDGLPFEAVTRDFPVGDDEAAAQYEFFAETLAEAGLRRYEVSNFARPGREGRHNLKYWRYEPFLGLGPSAASHLGSRRFTNVPGVRDWHAHLTRGAEPLAEVVDLSADRAWREALIFGLRLTERRPPGFPPAVRGRPPGRLRTGSRGARGRRLARGRGREAADPGRQAPPLKPRPGGLRLNSGRASSCW
jgi:oxygen-independent coproporphyrinogen-3 oxidase